jgi:formylmethanofuran dehydrogenase subunit E
MGKASKPPKAKKKVYAICERCNEPVYSKTTLYDHKNKKEYCGKRKGK